MATNESTYPIEIGDEVTVWFNDQASMEVTVLGTPSATGDTWKLREANGDVIYLNPNSSEFLFIRKEKQD